MQTQEALNQPYRQSTQIGNQLVSILIIIGVIVLSLVGSVQAQGPAIEDVTINYLEANPAGPGEVTVSAYISVTDANGQPISGLRRDQFTALEDGSSVAAMAVNLANDPIAVILVIDTSGTMAAQGPDGKLAIEAAKEAAITFIQALSPEDQIAVYSFSDEVTLAQNLTIDHNAAINAINSLNYQDFGHTCLYDAAFQAVKKSAAVPQGRRAIVVLTDGVDETGDGPCSTHTQGDVIDEATTSSIKTPLFTVGLGDKINQRELARMAGLTGGRSLIAPDGAALQNLFRTIASQLKQQYLLTYRTQAPSGEHAVVIQVAANQSQGEDERRVCIPVPPSAAPTPIPTALPVSVAIFDAKLDTPRAGQMEVLLDLSPTENVVRSALYINDNLVQAWDEPPFDSFVFETSELKVGLNIIRVDVTDTNGQLTADRRNLEFTPSPTPAPIPTPTPEVSGPLTGNTLIFILAGLLLLLIVGAGVYYLLKQRQQQHEALPGGASPSDPPTMHTFVTEDNYHQAQPDPYATMDQLDPYQTVDTGASPPPAASLVIVVGPNSSPGTRYQLNQGNTTLGRNAPGSQNDIDFSDEAISRRHAEIRYQNGTFQIEDCGSRFGTMVGDQPVNGPVALNPGDEILLGNHTKLRFELETETLE